MAKILLTKEEVENLKDFCDDNLAAGYVKVYTEGRYIKAVVKDLPETLTDITDREYL
jgi:hypothetical protein